jgi:FlaA1/EpsC-like NDP-sugar epimerase
MGIDVALLLLALLAAHWLTYPRSQPVEFGVPVVFEAVVLSLACLVLLLWRGAYSVNPRYFGLGDFLGIGLSVSIVTVFQFCLPVTPDGDLKRSLARGLLFAGMLAVGLSSVRIVKRIRSWQDSRQSEVKVRRTLIIGAGDAAEMIMREIKRSSHPVHRIVGFVDDDPEKQSSLIHQVPVLGRTPQIPELVKDHDIEELLIALPSATGEDMRRITQLCQSSDARVRTLPPVKTLLTGGPQIFSHLREVDIEDLLRREPVQTDLESIAKYISGERVLITGGGGSIGSELARQIASLSPANLVLLGKGENSIYEIEQELLQTNRFQPSCIIADVRDKASMEAAFEKFRPTVVFHAAAHKHVPLMQGNPIEAIRNNILGTWQTSDLAIKYGAKRFINVSTDKAVKPSSVMGATKRVGEMIVTSMGRRSETEFAIVRFGNVMGSRGSLIPLLKAQIKRGGPVRVTHPEMTRYFMTIPEAVQLILQAGAIGERGEIFILDMGDPIKILDLAMDLIRLHGLVPGEDIEVQFTGVRPGEKLYEELLYDTEKLSDTSHPKIRMVEEPFTMQWDLLRTEIQNLLELCAEGRAEDARHSLMELAWGKSVLGEFPLNQPTRGVVEG